MIRGQPIVTKTISSTACACPGTTPEACIPNDAWVTQWYFVASGPTGAPRPRDDDHAVSVTLGKMTGAEAFMDSVGYEPSSKQAKALRERHAEVVDLRAAGFAVVHTPGYVTDRPHVSIVYPDTDPITTQTHDWPASSRIKFDNCF